MKPIPTRFAVVAAALVVVGAARMAGAQDAAVVEFNLRVAAYLDFRSDFTVFVLPLEPTSEAERIAAASNALAASLRAARPEARIGDIFTTPVAAEFRSRIHDTLERQHLSAAEVVRANSCEAPAAPPSLAVNGRFDWRYGAATPGCLIAALPPLPRELQYRFVGAALVLVDVDARLIVDILADALVIDE